MGPLECAACNGTRLSASDGALSNDGLGCISAICSARAPAPTITAMGSAETTAGAFHWSEPRKLTIPELKRIMSLPDDFKLTGKWSQKAERCGRMVPPRMMEKIASSVHEKVLEKYND